jgi:pimeloyl-ACP methyl ester carboxylesterase
MKRFVSALTALVIALSVFSVTALAADRYKPFEDSRYFTYGDYDIHYRIKPAKGKTAGRIFMIHGFVCNTYSWRNMAEVMSENGYECVMADLPDFGYSTRETKDMKIVPREEIMIALMKSIAPLKEWIVAGHSMGGGVAVNIALRAPVKALLLYCPCAQQEFPAAAKGIVTSKPMESLMNAFFNYGTRITPLVKLLIFAATNDWEFSKNYDVRGVTDAVQYDGFGAGMCEMMYNVIPTELDRADEIKCPVLLCEAEKDIILNQTQKQEMYDAFPSAETYLVEGGGHQCIENRADELCEITTAFLDKQ